MYKYTFVPLGNHIPNYESHEHQNKRLKKLIKDYIRFKDLQYLQNDKISIFEKMKVIEKINGSGVKPLNLFSGIRNQCEDFKYF